jgi:spermidine synthase
VKHAKSLIQWLREEGGYIHPELELRPTKSTPRHVPDFGMFAKKSIQANDLLLRIPNSMLITPSTDDLNVTTTASAGTTASTSRTKVLGEEEEESQEWCVTVKKLAHEMKLGDESSYAPYINYILDTQAEETKHLPSAWSPKGQEVLQHVLALNDDYTPLPTDEGQTSTSTSQNNLNHDHYDNQDEDDTNQYQDDIILPPYDSVDWVDKIWHNDCKTSSDDPIEELAVLVTVKNTWLDTNILVPLYDMINHRNGHWQNADVYSDISQGLYSSVEVYAIRDIDAQEQIYTSYNFCLDCKERTQKFGTPEILRDYGFIEEYPQSWIFHDLKMGFVIDYKDTPDSSTENQELEVKHGWIERPEDINILKEMKDDLLELKETVLKPLDPTSTDIPDIELETINEYVDQMEQAMTVAITEFHNEIGRTTQEPTCNTATGEDGTCEAFLPGYTNLEQDAPYYETDVMAMLDTCDLDKEFEKLQNYQELEVIQSKYQTINFAWDPDTKDTCMVLDTTVQICDSYRPQYHDMSVHFPARFLKNVKRVLWVGGGDSMLLQEILKYDIELAVGLELDQRVVRGSFKHFGTQPHFDDDRVEWWFGDASKSLLMLPKDYFGSFDMVIVDLSETIMSRSVTEGLDIIGALTLLLKDDGIFVKNEVYFPKMVNLFPYTLQIHWYENPVICSQAMVLGSKKIDFTKVPLTDHHINSPFITPTNAIQDPFELYHDFAKFTRITSEEVCKIFEEKKAQENFKVQDSSPGILMIVEAEDVANDLLQDAGKLEHVITDVLRKVGFTDVVSIPPGAPVGEGEEMYVLSVTMKQGYIIARAFPGYNYCAFDIHLWSEFDLQEATKDELMASISGSADVPPTTFRVIAGGMYGVSTWRDDSSSVGPHYDQLSCAETFDNMVEDDEYLGIKDVSLVEEAMMASVKALHKMSLKVALLCGSNDSDKVICEKHREMLLADDSVNEVVILGCPMLSDFNQFSSDAMSDAKLCKKHLVNQLQESVVDLKFNALVVDSSADKFICSILLKALKGRRLKEVIRKEDVFVSESLAVASIMDKEGEWANNFIKRFKSEVYVKEPAFYVEMLLKKEEDNNFKLSIAMDGDEHGIQKLDTAMLMVKAKHSLDYDLQKINGGSWLKVEDFVGKQFYKDDYDTEGMKKQWKKQKPLGHQVILQMNCESRLFLSVLRDALSSAFTTNIEDMYNFDVEFKEFADFGEGYLFVSTSPPEVSQVNIVVLWDGRDTVNVNIFSMEQLTGGLDEIEAHFEINGIKTILRDEFPRGVGGVVSYKLDVSNDPELLWA